MTQTRPPVKRGAKYIINWWAKYDGVNPEGRCGGEIRFKGIAGFVLTFMWNNVKIFFYKKEYTKY